MGEATGGRDGRLPDRRSAKVTAGLWIVIVVRPERLELPTLWFEAKCSIQLSYGRTWVNQETTIAKILRSGN